MTLIDIVLWLLIIVLAPVALAVIGFTFAFLLASFLYLKGD